MGRDEIQKDFGGILPAGLLQSNSSADLVGSFHRPVSLRSSPLVRSLTMSLHAYEDKSTALSRTCSENLRSCHHSVLIIALPKLQNQAETSLTMYHQSIVSEPQGCSKQYFCNSREQPLTNHPDHTERSPKHPAGQRINPDQQPTQIIDMGCIPSKPTPGSGPFANTWWDPHRQAYVGYDPRTPGRRISERRARSPRAPHHRYPPVARVDDRVFWRTVHPR